MLSAEPALNHPTCSSLNVCVAWNSSTVPSGFLIEHCTGWSGVGGRPSTLMRSSSPIWSYVAGSAKVSGTTPCFFRFVSWIRAKLLAKITFALRNRGSIAACSRLEPSP